MPLINGSNVRPAKMRRIGTLDHQFLLDFGDIRTLAPAAAASPFPTVLGIFDGPGGATFFE